MIQFILHVFMLHTYVPSAILSINGVLWTIAVETHFYLLYPLLLKVIRRNGWKRTIIGLFILSVIVRCVAAASSEDIRSVLDRSVFATYWEWGIGCLIAEKLVQGGMPRQRTWRVLGPSVVGTLFLSLVIQAVPRFALDSEMGRIFGSEIAGLLMPVVYAALVHHFCGIKRHGLSGVQLLGSLGSKSYSLYLTHPISFALYALALHHIGVSWSWVAALCGIPFVMMGSSLFYEIVEKRFVRSSEAMKTSNYNVWGNSDGMQRNTCELRS